MLAKEIKGEMECRPGCGACCIHISISSRLPGMENGKSAGIKCINLSDDSFCRLYETEQYPSVCRRFRPSVEMCGDTTEDAIKYLKNLEELTKLS